MMMKLSSTWFLNTSREDCLKAASWIRETWRFESRPDWDDSFQERQVAAQRREGEFHVLAAVAASVMEALQVH